ncbi:MAG: gamma-glutamylcyclotransferase family protein [Thiotrichales bacterium]
MVFSDTKIAGHVFVYGSLMFEPVWERVVDGHYQSIPAILKDHERLAIHGALFPGVRVRAGAQVQGKVWMNVTVQDLHRLNHFESDFYDLTPAIVDINDGSQLPVSFYLMNQSWHHLLDPRPWDARVFEADHLQAFIASSLGA